MALIFFGKSSAKDILHGFKTCLGALLKEKRIQISFDGLDVNFWQTFDRVITKFNWARFLSTSYHW